MGEQAELDLRVIGREQDVARLGDEGGADAASKFGADGNILEIRIGGRKTAGGGSSLAEGSVQASGGGIDERGQRVDVGGLQLGELAVVEDHAGDGMLFGEIFQHVDSSGNCASLPVFEGFGEIQLIEENVAELARRGDVEFGAGDFVNISGLGSDFAFEFG